MDSGATPADLGLASVDCRIVEAVQGASRGVDASIRGVTIDSLLAEA